MDTIFPISRSNDLDARIPDNKRESCLPAVRFYDEAIWPWTACCIALLAGSCNATERATDGSCGVPDIDSVARRIYHRVHGLVELDCGDIPDGLGVNGV